MSGISSHNGSAPLLLVGAGQLVSGRMSAPLLAGDSVLCQDGRIVAVGSLDDVHPGGRVLTLDVNGATIAPALIDPHTHPVLGDYTPRQQAHGWIESYLHGGVGTLISAGEPHWPGRVRTAVAAKAMAIVAASSAASLRPGGAKLVAGALLLERGLDERDFLELADAGVRLLGEIGIASVCEPEEARPLVALARRHGFVVPVHVGGASIPGSVPIGADTVLALQPDVACHVNGGPTAPALEDVEAILQGSQAAIEVVQAGNTRALIEVVRMLDRHDALDRLQIGSDTPSGTGVIPLAILRVIGYVSALGGVDPAVAMAAASGQTATRYGLPRGLLESGCEADLCVLDAPVGSSAGDALGALELGDTPSVTAMVMDGEVRLTRSRMTPPPMRPVRWGSG